MKQPANFREERDLDRASVDVVSKVLQIGMEVFVKILWGGVVGHQNTDVHLVCDVLQSKPLEVLAHGSVGLTNLDGFVQNLFIEGKEGFEWEEDSSLVYMVDTGKELSEVEALNCHCIKITLGFDEEDQIVVGFVDPGDGVLECWVWDGGWGRFCSSGWLPSRLQM